MPHTKLQMVSNVFTQHEDKGSEFEKKFTAESIERINKYKENTRFSPKQIAIVDQMYAKYCATR